MSATTCDATSPRTGQPCRLAATHLWRFAPACRWHGDPALRADAVRRGGRLRWDANRLEDLYRLVELGLDDVEIGRRLGCTANAAKIARQRNRLPSRSRLLLSSRDVADLLGKRCAKSVARWIGEGWLKGRKAYRQGPHRVWLVRWEHLEAFVADPAHWHRWRADRVTHAGLLRTANRPASARFLTYREAAAACGVERDTVGNWVAKGWLPAARDGKGNRQVRADHLAEFRRGWAYGDGWRGVA